MKTIMEEYGGIIVALIAVGVLIGYLPKLKCMYEVAGQLFLNSIGG